MQCSIEIECMGDVQGSPSHCHSWQGNEAWLPFEAFSVALHSPPLHVLLGCDSWQVHAFIRHAAAIPCSACAGCKRKAIVVR